MMSIQGQDSFHKGQTYLVEMIETSVDEKDALVIIARSATGFLEKFTQMKHLNLSNHQYVDCPPQLRTIIKVGKS